MVMCIVDADSALSSSIQFITSAGCPKKAQNSTGSVQKLRLRRGKINSGLGSEQTEGKVARPSCHFRELPLSLCHCKLPLLFLFKAKSATHSPFQLGLVGCTGFSD